MNKNALILVLIAVVLAGTTSYASMTDSNWNPDQVVDAKDPGLIFNAQGSGTYALVDPSCGPCVAAMKAQLRLKDKTAFSSSQADASEGSVPGQR